jgi:uncharacterized protein YggL (DUF469 family)
VNKRLRKKKRVGEFAEFGFQVAFRVDDSLAVDGCNAIAESFIGMIEAAELQFGGGYGGRSSQWEGFTCGALRRG